ncbi:two-component sensor histidine kinase [Actinomyces bowdenii]|uniref:sensor histidine kinase n=1 Tax=Actinomyces bowdenii TaxID=131109 RepID=UPI001ABC859C|nr:histidine kinase [Actinomyces bowdenii]MBO3725057.1 two-component sensor histidine kinase [Actinomyces bowdenii]
MTWTITVVTTLLIGLCGSVAVPVTGPRYVPMLVLAGLVGLVVATMWLRRRDRVAYEQSLAREAAARAVAEDRLAIARDLHDTISGGLGAITVRAAVAQRLDSHPEQLLRALADIQEASRQATDGLRDMLVILRSSGIRGPGPGLEPCRPLPGSPAPGRPTAGIAADRDGAHPAVEDGLTGGTSGGLRSAVPPPRELADSVAALVSQAGQQGVEARVSIAPELTRGAGLVPAALIDAVGAVIREALSNTARHAGPVAATIRLWWDDERDGWCGDGHEGLQEGAVHLRIADAGPAPGWVPRPGTGLGLRVLGERVQALGGELWTGSRMGARPGFVVEARLPLPGSARHGAARGAARRPQCPGRAE